MKLSKAFDNYHLVHFDDEPYTIDWMMDCIADELWSINKLWLIRPSDNYNEMPIATATTNKNNLSKRPIREIKLTVWTPKTRRKIVLKHTITESVEDFRSVMTSFEEQDIALLDWFDKGNDDAVSNHGCFSGESALNLIPEKHQARVFILSGYANLAAMNQLVNKERTFSKPPDISKLAVTLLKKWGLFEIE